jgi:hypothetical protein
MIAIMATHLRQLLLELRQLRLQLLLLLSSAPVLAHSTDLELCDLAFGHLPLLLVDLGLQSLDVLCRQHQDSMYWFGGYISTSWLVVLAMPSRLLLLQQGQQSQERCESHE